MAFQKKCDWKALAASVILLAAAPSLQASSETVEQRLLREFPGWTPDVTVQGDLNLDGKADVVATLKRASPGAEDEVSHDARLAIFLRQADGALKLAVDAPKAVCLGCGGAKSNPDAVLGMPTISTGGVLTLTYEGGSREMWTTELKWREEPSGNRFQLIGETTRTVDTLSADGSMEPGEQFFLDANWSTGRLIRSVSGQGTFACRFTIPKDRDLVSFDFQGERRSAADYLLPETCRRYNTTGTQAGRAKPSRPEKTP